MGRCVLFVQKLLRKLDLFPATQFIRYKGDAQYTTATGGFVSVAVIIIFMILFASMAIKTVNREIINASTTVNSEIDPVPIKMITSPKGGFMFAISVLGFNLNDPTITYFNITLRQNFFTPLYKQVNSTLIPLVTCTPEHLAFNQQLQPLYQKFQFQKFLCPPLGFEFTIGGKVSSDISSEFSIYITQCNGTVNPKCINSSFLPKIEYTLAIPVIYSMVNPGDQNYKSFYLQDRNFYNFDLNNGIKATAYVQEQEIDTDISILPFTDQKVEKVIVIPELFRSSPMPVVNNFLAKISFVKSGINVVYSRSFNKVDAYFSYVGGLVGTIISLIFILNAYSERAFDVSIASRLFLSDDSHLIPSTGFNFFYFFSMIVKNIFDFFGRSTQKWTKTNLFHKCTEEIEQQLDISVILKRIIFLERSIEMLFSEGQFDLLFLRKLPTLNQAQTNRKKHEVNKKLYASGKVANEVNDKNNIMIDMEDSSYMPTDQKRDHIAGNLIVEKHSEKQIKTEHLSDQDSDLSVQSVAVKKMKQTFKDVLNQCKKGDYLSQRILEQIEPDMLRQQQVIMVKENEKKSSRIVDQGLNLPKKDNETDKIQDQENFVYDFEH